MKKTEIVAVTLANGDCALFINGNVVYSVEACDKGDPANPVELGIKMSTSLNVTAHAVEMAVPSDEDWNWQDVYELLPPFDANEDPDKSIRVEHWNSTLYGAELESSVPYLMRVADQRETHGQIFIDVQPVEGHVDDMGLGVILEINNTPGMDDSHVPAAHISFGSGEMAFTIFQDALDRLILRPETGVHIASGEILPNGEHAYIARGA